MELSRDLTKNIISVFLEVKGFGIMTNYDSNYDSVIINRYWLDSTGLN